MEDYDLNDNADIDKYAKNELFMKDEEYLFLSIRSGRQFSAVLSMLYEELKALKNIKSDQHRMTCIYLVAKAIAFLTTIIQGDTVVGCHIFIGKNDEHQVLNSKAKSCFMIRKID